jgi:uncharacterized protein (TIGR02594 family)
MVVLTIVRRLLLALALCSAAIAAFSSSASARSYHHYRHYTHVRHVAHYTRHYVHRQYSDETESHPGWDMAGTSNWNRAVTTLRQKRFAHVQASVTAGTSQGESTMTTSGGGSELVSEARRYLGGNPTSRRSLWCARFMNMVLERTGHHGTGSDMASSFAGYGHRISGPQVGAIAVMGHHVGIITAVDASGNPIMISGNNGNRVREAPISRGRIYAYVMPN